MRQGGQGNWEGGERRREGRGREVRTNLYPPPLTKTFRRACFATIWLTYDKVSYVKIRAYDSKNIIHMIRMLELWSSWPHRPADADADAARPWALHVMRRWADIIRLCRGGSRGWLVTTSPLGAAAYFMLLLCVWLKLFRRRFVPLLEPNPGDATAPRSCVQLLYRPDYSQWPITTVKSDCSLISSFPSRVSPDPLKARSLLALGFPKSPRPPLKFLDPPMLCSSSV